ncbi:GATA transcription factor 12 [Linum grandiflorum]
MDDVHQLYPDASSADANCATDHFIVEDLLDFSNEDDDDNSAVLTDAAPSSAPFDTTTDSSTLTLVDSCNSSSFSASDPPHFSDVNFSNDLCVPYDDLAELEWLSNIVEESFSSEDLQKLHLISGIRARPDDSSETTRNFGIPDPTTGNNNNPIFNADVSVPAKARSKRSRGAACNWASRLLVLSPSSSSSSSVDPPEIAVAPPTPPSPHHNPAAHYSPAMGILTGKKTVKVTGAKKREGGNNGGGSGGGGGGGGGGGAEGRKCLHCATDKTPQWRTGPMGPKTLCNACGVRYKSGRLVPEYRPAASPTFVLTKHSNSHRKVMELRKQKEMMRGGGHPHTVIQQQQHHHQQFLHGHGHPHHHHHHQHHHHHPSMVFDVSSNGDDYLIHQHVGPDFRQLI